MVIICTAFTTVKHKKVESRESQRLILRIINRLMMKYFMVI